MSKNKNNEEEIEEGYNDNYKLCFINKLYVTPKDENVYRFYFTDDIDNVIGDYWGQICSNMVKPPHKAYIKETYTLKTKKEFELLCDNDYHTYIDGADDIIALAWEYSEDETPQKRISFRFGETVKDIDDKLFRFETCLKEE